MALHVVDEARRCLNCKKPQCRTGCPIQTDIPHFIQLFLNGKIDEAGELLFNNNPLSLVCSLVCNHENQCEGHCILGKKGSPVHISSIENYISDTYFDKRSQLPSAKQNIRAAIIGSGPAGITIAIILAQRGYDVTIFEAKDHIGGVLRYGIPDFRLPKTILSRYKKELLRLGIKIRPNTTIGGALCMDDLFRDGYKAVFIGTGVWRPNSLGIKGESLGNVHYAIDYLCNPGAFNLGESVSIIGAGNSAMDVARTALRHGVRRVTVFSRTDKLSASKREVEYAAIDGVVFENFRSPVEITPEGAIFETVEVDEEGNKNIVPGSAKLYPSDSVIVSISQGPKDKIVSTTYGIEVGPHGLVLTDENGMTTRPGVFASGDVVKGAKTVVEAVSYSKMVADAMDAYMQATKEEK